MLLKVKRPTETLKPANVEQKVGSDTNPEKCDTASCLLLRLPHTRTLTNAGQLLKLYSNFQPGIGGRLHVLLAAGKPIEGLEKFLRPTCEPIIVPESLSLSSTIEE